MTSMQQWLDDVNEELTPPQRAHFTELAADARQRLLRLVSTPVPAVPAHLQPATLGAVSDEWLDAELRHQADVERATAERKLLEYVIADADRQAQTAVADDDALLRRYNQRLQVLLRDAAAIVDTLGSVRTAGKAIDAELHAEWLELTKLAKEYRELRAAQTACYDQSVIDAATAIEGSREDHASLTHIRNLDDVWPTWRYPHHGQDQLRVDGAHQRREPWPVDPVELLIWLVTSPARAWIPTAHQVHAVVQQLRKARNAPPAKSEPSSASNRFRMSTYDGEQRYRERVSSAVTPTVTTERDEENVSR